MSLKILRHNNWNKVKAYLGNVLITEVMTNKSGTRDTIIKPTPSPPL